jgi:uncharacterized protein (TIGR03437 family)
MKTYTLISAVFSCLAFVPAAADAQTTTPTCSASTLTGTRSLVITGRNLSSSAVLTGAYQSLGTATFDGVSAVSFSLTTNTNLAQGVAQTFSGTYTLPASCVGSINLTTGDTASFTLIAFNKGNNFTITGQDATYAFTGSGNSQPTACLTSTLSGNYAFSGNGYTFQGTSLSGVNSISGLLQFDGKGAITGSWSVATNGVAAPDTVTGHYAVTSSCAVTGSVANPAGTSFPLAIVLTTTDGSNFSVNLATAGEEFSATGHSTFTNPGLAVVSAASGLAGATPAGSIFALYGRALTTGSNQANSLPLPTTLLGTTVTVNGEAAPLFYASPTQINAQMPLDIQPGLVSVVIANGGTTSNTAAVSIPAAATPGIFIVGGTNNRAVVQNPNFSVNSSSAPAHVGDTVVGYFTGGGPVTAAGRLVTGAASPNGLSPVTGTPVVVTLAGQAAKVNYIGLTPTLVGVYQVNFVVPQVAVGDRLLSISIAGNTSPALLMTVAN